MARAYLPPGFRFHPTDEELLVHYLKKKILGREIEDCVIGEVDIYKFEPADLPGLAILHSRDPEWFFFNVKDKRNLHGSRTNRLTRAGYWKATGKDRMISVGRCSMGTKKTLIYYLGRSPSGERTDWVMHEYRLDEEYERRMKCSRSFVLCRVRRKGGLGPRNGEQYGAPVLEPNEEDEALVFTSHSPPQDLALNLPLEHGPCPVQVTANDDVVGTWRPGSGDNFGDDFDSLFESLFGFEEQEQLIEKQSSFAAVESLQAALPLDPSQHTNKTSILEDILHLVETTDLVGANDGRALPPRKQGLEINNVRNVGFLELADLEEPLDEFVTLESIDAGCFEGLISEEVNGMESTGEGLHLVNLFPFDGGISSTIDGSGILSGPEVQGIVNYTHNRLITSDEESAIADNLPSGFGLDLNKKHLSVPGQSYVGETDECFNQFGGFDPLDRGQLVSSLEEISEGDFDHGENLLNGSPRQPNERTDLSPSRSSSPSALTRVISEILGKIDVLPASAAELRGVDARRRKLLCPGAAGKLGQGDVGPTSIRYSLQSWDTSTTPCRGYTSRLSSFLFFITTWALILFCLFRGICRSTRMLSVL